MDMNLHIGLEAAVERIVGQNDTAAYHGSGNLDVLATPVMIAMMENAAMSAVGPYLESGYSTVGTKIDVKHMAATPVGMKVAAKAELAEIDGRRLVFKVTASDEKDIIGEGSHERFIISAEKFMDKAGKKLNKL